MRHWTVGQRVGVGWFGGNCGHCEWCRRGSLIDCTESVIPGITADGGYADYVVVDASALASIPDELSDVEAAPLLCAGITTFNALRTAGVPGGGRVAVLGIGGLGHLAVQYSRKLGYETIAVARGTDKEPLARELGAHHYIDSTDGDPAAKLSELGGVDLIMATVTNAGAMAALFGGLRPNGKLLVIGADMEPLPIPAAGLIAGSKQIAGHASGTSIDSEDTLRFSAQSRCAADDRDAAAGARGRGLRQDDARRRPLPDGAHHRLSGRVAEVWFAPWATRAGRPRRRSRAPSGRCCRAAPPAHRIAWR